MWVDHNHFHDSITRTDDALIPDDGVCWDVLAMIKATLVKGKTFKQCGAKQALDRSRCGRKKSLASVLAKGHTIIFFGTHAEN